MLLCRAGRTIKGKTSVEDRFYIASVKEPAVEKMAHAVRAHWGIENPLHWVLGIAFGEDQSRIRLKNADQNMAIIRKLVINVIKPDKKRKGGVKAKRLMAGWDNTYLEHLFGVVELSMR